MRIVPNLIRGYAIDENTGAFTILFDRDVEFVIRREAKEIAEQMTAIIERENARRVAPDVLTSPPP